MTKKTTSSSKVTGKAYSANINVETQVTIASPLPVAKDAGKELIKQQPPEMPLIGKQSVPLPPPEKIVL